MAQSWKLIGYVTNNKTHRSLKNLAMGITQGEEKWRP